MEAPGLDTSFINGTEFVPEEIRRYVDYCYGNSNLTWTEALSGVDTNYIRRFDYWRGPFTDGLTLIPTARPSRSSAGPTSRSALFNER